MKLILIAIFFAAAMWLGTQAGHWMEHHRATAPIAEAQ